MAHEAPNTFVDDGIMPSATPALGMLRCDAFDTLPYNALDSLRHQMTTLALMPHLIPSAMITHDPLNTVGHDFA